MFNLPKSQLQCYGESVYCTGGELLSRCAHAETSLERFISVVAWSISTIRPLMFGVAPYNPILGETHHVSRGGLNVLLEQVISCYNIYFHPLDFHSSTALRKLRLTIFLAPSRLLSAINLRFYL